MARLEYRLLDTDFPVLFYYNRIDLGEISMRFACDYLVKEGKVYEKTSCAVEDGDYVIYVQEAVDERALNLGDAGPTWKGIRVELRQFREDALHYPVMAAWDFDQVQEVILRLQSNYVYTTRDGRTTEWEKMSAEVDEDRKLYVVYAKEASRSGRF